MTAYDKNYVNGVLKRTLKIDDDSTDYTDKYFNYERKEVLTFLINAPFFQIMKL